MDGVSLLPTIRNPPQAPQAGASRSRPWRRCSGATSRTTGGTGPTTGVRTDRYTYVVYRETGEQELYDRRKDPYQLTNVAADPAYAAIKAKLAAKLAKLDTARALVQRRP